MAGNCFFGWFWAAHLWFGDCDFHFFFVNLIYEGPCVCVDKTDGDSQRLGLG